MERLAYLSFLGYYFKPSARSEAQKELIADRERIVVGAKQYARTVDPLPASDRKRPALQQIVDAKKPFSDPLLAAILVKYSWGEAKWAPFTAEDSTLHTLFRLRLALKPHFPEASSWARPESEHKRDLKYITALLKSNSNYDDELFAYAKRRKLRA